MPQFQIVQSKYRILIRDEVFRQVSHFMSLLYVHLLHNSRCHGNACTRKHRLASFRKQKWRNVRKV